MGLKFELVLPCYNEEKSLETLITRARSAAQQAGLGSEEFKLVLVENGSKDNSAEVLKSLSKKPDLRDWFRSVSVKINQGYGFGIYSGLQSTTAPFIGWSHADQQCDPTDAFRALKTLESLQPADQERTLIKGIRRGRSAKEKFVSRVFEFFCWILLGFRIYEINAQPKVFRRELLAVCPEPPKDFAFDLYVLYRAKKQGYTFKTIPVEFPSRIHGLSNWAATLKGRRKTILNMIRYMHRLGKLEGRV